MFCLASKSILHNSLIDILTTIVNNCVEQIRTLNCLVKRAVFSVYDLIRAFLSFLDDDKRSLECWICYDPDRQDRGSMIQPCNCKGDVGAVHHDCLRRWLVEVSF